MIRRLLSTSILFSFGLIAWSQTSLEGKVTDLTSGETVIFANVVLFKNGNLLTGVQTDLDGNYFFSNIDPGTYDVEVSYTGYPTQRQTNVVVLAGKSVRLDFKMDAGLLLDQIVVTEYIVPLIEQDNTTTGGIKTAEQIRNLPTKNINAIAATTAGLSSIDGGGINIRGSRDNATNYYVDGIRVDSRQAPPQSEIEQLQVITGGIEARYGDVTGGLISLTTKGPSSQLSGAFEVESSELTDPYGYNLFSGNISGPILKNKTTNNAILGFRLSGQYRNRDDTDPQAFGAYRATEEAIARISANPITYVNGNPLILAEQLEADDVELLKARPNTGDERYDITGKLDFRMSNAIDLQVGGNYYDYNRNFTPANNRAWNLLNWPNNPYEERNGYIVNARFRHRLGEGDPNTPGASSIIRNVSYTLQYGYEKSFHEQGDARFRDSLFNYGYVGKFDVFWNPAVGYADASDSLKPTVHEVSPGIFAEHLGYSETFADGGYTPSAHINPLLNNYNKGQTVLSFRDYNAYNGLWADVANSVYELHTGTGAVYNRFEKSEDDTHTGNLSASFDLFPGGSNKGRHNIQFGLMYEQRHNRAYIMLPRDLWNKARLAANSKHILGLHPDSIVGTQMLPFNEEISFEVPVHLTFIEEQPNLLFYREIRKLTGQTHHEYVNIDAIDPRDLSLNMFAASELIDNDVFNYYGYDYLGNKLPFDVTFDDFFTATENGIRTFPVAGQKPIYSAAYIQDKFTFKDIIFRLGVRVDRYDANTKVLKDPYSLYQIITAKDFYELDDVSGPRPENVGEDWKVYVNSSTSTQVRAYRDGDQWYTAEGTPVNDGFEILGNEIPNPYFVVRELEDRDIKAEQKRDPDTGELTGGFDPTQSFEDYEPQINVMPRLAFSFPISDAANFFVHYDVLVQRPPSNTIATALNYYEWADGPPRNNPNLKPEKTIDFEVGFKQKITNSSAITLTAYYKELRDMIQSQNYLFVPGIPGNSYESYGNQDFGTVKGFSFSYDLRRTLNLEMTAAYTLQFADGTGSSATTQDDLGLNTRGNLRYLSPLTFDERHRLSANIDYRFSRGALYNGPRWFGKDIFADAGISIQASAASGRPYTKRQKPEIFGASGIGGGLNQARLPWNFGVDMRADKSFQIGGVESGKPLFANVYLRIENVFDSRSIIDVYTASGSPYDDGFLVTPSGISAVETLEDSGRAGDIDNYRLSYQWGLLNSNFFTMPRRVYLGATLAF